jgi:hypothetical protein
MTKSVTMLDILDILIKYECDNLKTLTAVLEVLKKAGVEPKIVEDKPVEETAEPKSLYSNEKKEGEKCIGFQL